MDYKANDLVVETTENKSSNGVLLYANAWEERKLKKEEKKDA